MTIELPAFYGTFLCSTGIKQYSLVDITSTGTSPNKVSKLVTTVSTKGLAIGVMVSSGTTNSTVRKNQTVQFLGITKVRSGSNAFVAGDLVKVSTATAGAADRIAKGATSAQHYAMGVAVGPSQSTKSDGTELLPFLLTQPGRID